MIPGPIGAIAAGVSAVSYAAAGDWKNAAMMTAGIALAAVGAGAAIVAAKAVRGARAAIGAVKIAAKARKIASKAAKITSKATKLASKARSKVSKASKAAKRGYQSARNRLSGCLTHSFAPDTPVLMADGTTKPIAAVALGDQVQSTDPATGKTSAQPVTAFYLNHDTDLVDVTVANDKGQTTVLHTTWHHPFWNETTHQWTDAADLKPGTQLHSTNGSVEHVVAIRTWTGLDWMHDLTVATNHTYYVIAGDASVLVHNRGFRTHDKARGAEGVNEMTATFERFHKRSNIYSETFGNGFKFWTPYGERQVDIAISKSGGRLDLYEIKVNRSNYTRSQRRKDQWLEKTYGFAASVIRRNTKCPICFSKFP